MDSTPTGGQIKQALAVLLWLSEQRQGDGRLRDAIALVCSELHDEAGRLPSGPRSADPCPVCGAKVEAVLAPCSGQTYTDPCGHRVTVTLWPDRVQLHRAVPS